MRSAITNRLVDSSKTWQHSLILLNILPVHSRTQDPMPRVGLISDTHGLLRPEATAFLKGSDFIVHAGDIGGVSILDGLAAVAPVTAVRGNNDTGEWAKDVPEFEVLQAGEILVYVLH